MKSVSGKHLSSLLERRGWSLQRITGSHHIYTKTGSEVRITVPVHGNKTLKIGLQRHLMKLAGIKDSDL